MKQDCKILIVDDERDLCEILQFNLEGEGYSTDIAYSAEEALKKNIKLFNLILLDVMMEEMSGFSLAKKIKQDLKINIPIIFITAKNTENDMLTGFNLGGDDYITKPFSLKEVIARVKAVLSRQTTQVEDEPIQTIKIDNMELNIAEKRVFINKKEIHLTKKEFEILTLLLENKGKVFPREKIIDYVWNDSIVTDRTIDVHITRLRKKIGKYGDHIKTKSGFGYIFDVN